MNFLLVVAIGFAVLFHRMAAYEHMSAWAWAIASFALSLAVTSLWAGFLPLILAQIGLFAAMWWYNVKRVDTRERHWTAKREEDRRMRDERMRRAQEEIQRDRARRQHRADTGPSLDKDGPADESDD